LVTLPARPGRDKALGKFARQVIERARRRVEGLRDTPTTDVTGLHELRIAYKELRYAAELFAAALPSDLAAMAEPAARFQKRLGEVHDVDVALQTVRRARTLDVATRTEVLEHLEAMRDKKVRKYESEMAPAAEAEGAHTEEAPQGPALH